MTRVASWQLTALAVVFLTSGSVHLVRPAPFERIVPHALPAKRTLVYVSGIAELACAAGLVIPSTRRVSGLVSAGLLVAVFPANLQMTFDVFRSRGPVAKTLALARLPLQVPAIRTAWRAWTA
ncbi:MAG: DoxX family protein [Propionibacteriales bacterium]|nr:DoxX family protein [Propionibacteriales bacterium]